jgi:hypothetical protein
MKLRLVSGRVIKTISPARLYYTTSRRWLDIADASRLSIELTHNWIITLCIQKNIEKDDSDDGTAPTNNTRSKKPTTWGPIRYLPGALEVVCVCVGNIFFFKKVEKKAVQQ